MTKTGLLPPQQDILQKTDPTKKALEAQKALEIKPQQSLKRTREESSGNEKSEPWGSGYQKGYVFDQELNVNPFKFLASVGIGLPVAAAATAFVGIFIAIAKAIQLAGLHISKAKGAKQDPMASILYDTLIDGLKNMWTDFGVYSVIAGGEVAKAAFNQLTMYLDPQISDFFKSELTKTEEKVKNGEITKAVAEQKMQEGINGGAGKIWSDKIKQVPKEGLEELNKHTKQATMETAMQAEDLLGKQLSKEQAKKVTEPIVAAGAAISNTAENRLNGGGNPGPNPSQGSGIPQKDKDGKWKSKSKY